MVYMGIDPGKGGGIGIIDESGFFFEEGGNAWLFDENILRNQCSYIVNNVGRKNVHIVVESVHAMPGQGVSSMFTFGKGFGYILGVLDSYRLTYELVSPQKWKKEFSVTSDKKTSIETCKRLFPDVDLKATDKSRTDHDGMAEALLMAEYGRRKNKVQKT